MVDVIELLELCRSVATEAGRRLVENPSRHLKEYVHSPQQSREIKAIADTVLEVEILNALVPTGLTILSEESGFIRGRRESEYHLIVDPLDGTFNFAKGLGPCAVSIALWESERPVFGVIYSLTDRQLFWGGAGIGSYCEGQPLSVSTTSTKAQASICTGFPARFDVENAAALQTFWRLVKPYGKVRMLGSAAMSLVHVARGSTDVYSEADIMLWDVAAGLAIVEGAGGSAHRRPGTVEHSLDVYASNSLLGDHGAAGV